MSDSETNGSTDPTQLIIARWTDRFFAWLIDVVILWIIGFTIVSIVIGIPNIEFIMSGEEIEYSYWAEISVLSFVNFIYWVILEYKTGQSIGKRALQLKTTNLKGDQANIISILISSFGKAFPYLLPIDVILGRLFANEKRQRLFNRLGKTIVIKIENKEEPENITYKKD